MAAPIEETPGPQPDPGAGQLRQAIDQATVMQITAESQQVLQGILDNLPVFEQMSTYYPKSYQAILSLVTAFENLSHLLQEAGLLSELPPDENGNGTVGPDEGDKVPPKGDKAKSGDKELPIGTVRSVKIGSRVYRRIKQADGWHYQAGAQQGQSMQSGPGSSDNYSNVKAKYSGD